ncbi:peptidoglycan-binding domain-containing protein [Nocardioides sp. WV_118_6]
MAADAAPPPASELTAPVREAPLRTQVVTRGEVSLGPTYELVLPGTGVLTSLDLRPAQRIIAGQQVASVNDRPVLVLPGRIPLWRDLVEGDRGADVARVQQALEIAGHPVADVSGVYGPSTVRAIESLYEEVGSTASTEAVSAGDDGAPPGRPAPSSADSSSVRPNLGSTGLPERKQILPRSEIAMVPELPAEVAEIKASLGSVDTDRSVILAVSTPVVRAKVSVGDAEQIAKGASVRIVPEGANATWRGKVVSVSEPSLDDEEGFVATLVVRPRRHLPLSDQGRQVQLTVKGARTEVSLIVPVTAVWQEADGGMHVVVVEHGGKHRRVSVVVLKEASGSVSVQPSGAAQLKSGDQVLVGVR